MTTCSLVGVACLGTGSPAAAEVDNGGLQRREAGVKAESARVGKAVEPGPQVARLPTVHADPASSERLEQDIHNTSRDVSGRLLKLPELGWRDRGNAAQDVQIQSRGFGARASFGIRGLRLFLDDVPLSANDGQGSVAAIPAYGLGPLAFVSAPESLRYGNAAGGVLMSWSPAVSTGWNTRLRTSAGPSDQDIDARMTHRPSASNPGWSTTVMVRQSDGDRPHIAYRRGLVHAVLDAPIDSAVDWRATFNWLEVPEAEDPLGISPAQWQSGIDTDSNATVFDTRKSVRSGHAGFSVTVPTALGDWKQVAWLGQREVEQFLAIPVAAQANTRHPGGVVDLSRDFGGSLGTLQFPSGWSVGVEWVNTHERRRGFENYSGASPDTRMLGVRGALRRDETNRLRTQDLFVGHERALGDHWALDASVRYGDWRLSSRDAFLANGDDSGRQHFGLWSGSVRLQHTPAGAWRQSLSWGGGAESPTLNELAYRSDGSAGVATNLTPARFNALEWRHDWLIDNHDYRLGFWQVDSRDEIVPAQSSGGRPSFQNAGKTRRRGVEWVFGNSVSTGHRLEGSLGLIDARFTEGFAYRVGTEPRVVTAGQKLPGIPRAQWRSGWFAEWSDLQATRVGLNWTGKTPADDRNTVFAPALWTVDLQWRRRLAANVDARIEINNVLDRRGIGSVIVNDTNGRFFEPAAGRQFWLSLEWTR